MVRNGNASLPPRGEETRRSTLPIGPPAGQISGGSGVPELTGLEEAAQSGSVHPKKKVIERIIEIHTRLFSKIGVEVSSGYP